MGQYTVEPFGLVPDYMDIALANEEEILVILRLITTRNVGAWVYIGLYMDIYFVAAAEHIKNSYTF